MHLRKNGIEITTLKAWFDLAPPKGKADHWRDEYSAKELAKAWVGTGTVSVPRELAALFERSTGFRGIEFLEAEPEARMRFDKHRGEVRNADLSISASLGNSAVAISVEAKAREPFGALVSVELANAVEALLSNPRSNAVTRIRDLAQALLPPRTPGLPPLRSLRYQLLTAAAGALAQAAKLGARQAVLVVHEFLSPNSGKEPNNDNAHSLNAFVHRLSGGRVTEVPSGTLVGPFQVPGAPLFRDPPDLFLGKVARTCDISSDVAIEHDVASS